MGRDDGCKERDPGQIGADIRRWKPMRWTEIFRICSCRLWHSGMDIWQNWSLSSWSSLCLSVSRCCRSWQHMQGMLESLQSTCCLNARLIQQISNSRLRLHFHLLNLWQESPCGPSQLEIWKTEYSGKRISAHPSWHITKQCRVFCWYWLRV